MSTWAQELGLPGWQWLAISFGFYAVAAVLSLLLFVRSRLIAAWSAFWADGGDRHVFSELDMTECLRLGAIADSDDKNALNLLIGGEATAKPHFDGPEPFVDLTVPIVNTTVFNFTVTGAVEGRMSWRSNPLTFEAVVVRPGQPLPRAAWNSVVIRQHVLPDTARQIRETDDAWIGTGNFGFFLTYERGGQIKTIKRGIAAQVRLSS